MFPAVFRLDDLSRLAFHSDPETGFHLFASPELSGVRTEIVRLDTQLAPFRRLPDVMYVCRRGEVWEIWIIEFQSRSRIWPDARASECVIDAVLRVCNPAAFSSYEIRVVEVRIREASQHDHRQSTDQIRTYRGRPDGLLCFQPSNVLVDAHPSDPRFASSATWPFLAFSRHVSADHVLEMHIRLGACADALAPEKIMQRQLLGHVGRARFTDDRRMWQLDEALMNLNSARISPHERRDRLTDEEWRLLVDDAIVRAYTELPERDRINRLEGIEDGKLEGKLEGAREFARRALSALVPAERLSSMLLDVERLQTPEEIQAFTINVLQRHR